jgi:hypothetical protein
VVSVGNAAEEYTPVFQVIDEGQQAAGVAAQPVQFPDHHLVPIAQVSSIRSSSGRPARVPLTPWSVKMRCTGGLQRRVLQAAFCSRVLTRAH